MYSESFITSSRGKKPLASSRTSNFKILFIRTKRSEESRLPRLAHARPPLSRLSLRRLPSAPLHAGVGFFPKARTSCALSAPRGSSGSKPDVSTMYRRLLNKKVVPAMVRLSAPCRFCPLLACFLHARSGPPPPPAAHILCAFRSARQLRFKT